jgi:addiction module HigA family antidote
MKPRLAKKMETQKRRPSTPGDILNDLLETTGISQSEFARHIGVSAATVNRLIQGHQTLTPDMAQRLGRYWGDGARVWLTHQQMVDHWDMAHTNKDAYEFIVPQSQRMAA